MDKLRNKILTKVAEVARHFIDEERQMIVEYINKVADVQANSNREKALRQVAKGIEQEEHKSVNLDKEFIPNES